MRTYEIQAELWITGDDFVRDVVVTIAADVPIGDRKASDLLRVLYPSVTAREIKVRERL